MDYTQEDNLLIQSYFITAFWVELENQNIPTEFKALNEKIAELKSEAVSTYPKDLESIDYFFITLQFQTRCGDCKSLYQGLQWDRQAR